MRIKIITLSLFFVTIFFSCKKEDILNDGGTNSTYVAILSKVLLDNQSTYEYSYNDSSMVTEEKSKYDFTAYHYNSKGQLKSSESYANDDILSSDQQVFQTAMNRPEWVTPQNGKKAGIITYEYNDKGQMVKTTYTRPSAGSSEYSAFSYDGNGKLAKQTMYWENIATGYINYSYDGNGNLIKEMLYNLPSSGTPELITTTKYDFDTEQNPFRAARKMMTPGIYTNRNNIVKETYTIHLAASQGSDKVQVTTTTYGYNAMGYPISKNGNITYVYK